MTTIVTRTSKGSPLSWVEADANLTNLNNDKLEASALTPYLTSATAASTYETQANAAATYETQTHATNTFAAKSANLSDLANAATARTNLGLGTAATLTAGTAANNLVQLDGTGKLPAVDGSLLTNLPSQSMGQQMVRLHLANGFGSTNTVIRRFSTVITNTGADLTYADSATAGASFTINTVGVYAISYGDCFTTANAWIGLSVNSSQLTTQINGITAADILAIGNTAGANLSGNVSWVGTLAAGAVVRAHCQAGLSAGSGSNPYFTIVRVE